MAEDMAYAVWSLRAVVVIFLLVPCIGALASVTQNCFDDQLWALAHGGLSGVYRWEGTFSSVRAIYCKC